MTTTVDDALDRLRRQDAAIPAPGTTLSIAETAERTGVTAHTLRYYERIGLITVGRDASGYRAYSAADFGRVVFLNRLRMTGMPIRELQRYVALAEDGPVTEPERLEMLVAHRESVLAQLAELQFALDTVDFKIATYGGTCRP
ncbi:MerR family transcriptional regulator [Pseudonocardia abyssalis]|uniref:MerR family transcriptional regulator n=1 Tax=Pseudonocardia abyssalis TaxID=2792008 RepID=A0ABS6UT92_9PSEU|nr:MerR family transcriptional regulator [Pseudonocardia abyssalis]MBW0116098.1 MerR family transcriptional regulator [Pseudonocardia abyssalis]MBW0135475.1 MerR family transcriptional regulator [Pseudonocardia abyssalis]